MNRNSFLTIGSILVVATLRGVPAAAVDRLCTIDAPGDACILDLRTTTAGSLSVSTRAGTANDRWRSTIGRTNASGTTSAVGTGATSNFTGKAALPVAASTNYEAIVTLDRPVSGNFPRSVQIRLAGPLQASVPQVRRSGIVGRERVFNQCDNATSCTVTCSPGKLVAGGGCLQTTGPQALIGSWPTTNGNEWECIYAETVGTVNAFAICFP